MATYNTSDIRKGLKLEMDGAPWKIVYFQFVKPGKGTAFTRTKLKNLITGNVIERTFRTGSKLEAADVESFKMQYLYNDGEDFHFMNTETYEQLGISAKALGDATHWLIEEDFADVLFYKGQPVSAEVSDFVYMVLSCDPGVKGNTAQGGTKPATLATGHTINVPLHIEDGTKVKIDTRTGEYVERVKE